MLNISFVCRKSKSNRNGLSPIEICLSKNYERTYIRTDFKCDATSFIKLSSSKKSNDVNTFISSMRIKINGIINRLNEQGIEVSPTSVKNAFEKKQKKITIKLVTDEFSKQYYDKVCLKECAKNTYKKYQIAIVRFLEFFDSNKLFSDITKNDIEQFRLYIKKEYKYDDSTVYLYIAKIKTIFVYAQSCGYITNNIFNNIKLTRKEKDIQFLTIDEVNRIYQHTFINDRLNNVRDLFIFACNSGLSYSDMAELSESDILTYDNIHYVKKPRRKTKVVYTAILNDVCMQILKKHNYILPILSNQKYNAYLKEIADICGINKPLHSHIARHTCATMLLNRHYPLEIVSKILGHSNIRMTTHYAKLLDSTIFEFAKKIG